MKKVLVCKVGEYKPGFWVPDSKNSEDGEWVFLEPHDLDAKDVERAAKAVGLTPEAMRAIVGCIEDLRAAVEEDLGDLYQQTMT